MGCFASQKAKKRQEEQAARSREADDAIAEDSSSPSSYSSPSSLSKPAPERLSFRKTAKAIQNAQRFISQSNPRGRSSTNTSHGSRDERSPDHGASVGDSATVGKPMPLPSPKQTCYALPHPSDHSNVINTSPNAFVKNTSASHAALNGRVFPSELQPLPPPADTTSAPKGLKFFSVCEIGTACQHISREAPIGDDGFCFNGIITVLAEGAKQQKQRQQEIVILYLQENLHLGLKEWLSEIYFASHPFGSHVCKLVGFYGGDGIQERYLVYEKLARGNLHSLLFESSDTRSLDWSIRLKLIQGAVAGLASLQQRFPEQVLYRDFRLSHIQCDDDYSAKISGYWFVTSNSQIVHVHVCSNSSNARDNAYCAPETRTGGVLTWKSTVWSLGVVMLELLCGRKNNDEKMAKDEKHNAVQWARPFLAEEDKLFLIMDPKLQGRFPAKGAKIMAKLILQCLHKDPTKRPTMKMALEMMKTIKEPRHTNMLVSKDRFMNEAPISMSAPLEACSPKSVFLDRNTRSYKRSPTKFDLIKNPALKPLVIPSRYSAD